MITLVRVQVDGFRLLENVEIEIEELATVIVGRNNSGKTSLTEVFDRFLGEQAGRFRLEDFSAAIRPKFLAAKALRDGDEPPEKVLSELPTIALTLTFRYNADIDDLGPLSPFVIDLDLDCTTAIARMEFSASLKTLGTLLDTPEPEENESASETLFRHLREAVPKAYSIKIFAIDPTDGTNRRTFDRINELTNLISAGFVKAQRTLDVSKRGDTDVIGKLLNKLFKTANTPTASTDDRLIADSLKASVADLEKAMQGDFDDRLKALLPALNTFGFPSLNDTELRPQTTIDVESLLTENTRILYTGVDGVHLPEGYNGLGSRNLIYILLQLEALHKTYRSMSMRPGTHLVFIEEPEAHLHPQMQEVFIGQLNEAVSTLSKKYLGETAWPVQFVVSTHSSHVANAAPFDSIRYFLNEPNPATGVRGTKVKDFRKGADQINPEDRRFLQQYMTLTKCDLYFADKAVLVEGASERILMPRITKILDADLSPERRLGRQYLTTIEVGGAYAQIFYPLLDYLELKTLIITDLDAVKLEDSRWKKCPCTEGARTSNSALKAWFKNSEVSVTELQAKTPEERTKGCCRIVYQTAEDGSKHCGRSFEDALILANLADFEIVDDANTAINAWKAAQDFKKSEEAIKYAIREEEWNVPKYIRDGLVWLSEPPSPPAAMPPTTLETEPEPEAI